MIRPLPEGEIHLWRASLADLAARRNEWLETLSIDERERTEQFRFERHRDAYIARRGMLRVLLASYAGREPRGLIFDYGEFGKPVLRDPAGVYFNLSHSGDWIVYAFAREERLGVDIERRREIPEVETIARNLASTTGPGDDFFQYWTRQEAYIKALGGSLGSPVPEFQCAEWTLVDFEPAAGYAGAIAVYGRSWLVREK